MPASLASIGEKTLFPGNTLARVSHRYEQFKAKFREFAQMLEYFNNPRAEIPGVEISVAEDKTLVTAVFADITVTLAVLPWLTPENALKGRVICRLENPEFRMNGTPPILGTFTFDIQGKTDFIGGQDDDGITIEYNAVEIVLHYLTLGLKYEPQ